MKPGLTTTKAALGAAILGALVALFFTLGESPTVPESRSSSVQRPSPPETGGLVSARRAAPELGNATNDTAQTDEPEWEEEPAAEAGRWKFADIEDIKQALYDRDIDSVDKLHLLEEFVEIEDADTRDFWNTDWTGVDDWKRQADGFSLEELDDGTLVFVPGEETRRAYSFFETMNIYDYDDESREFIYEIDYYGKPIRNVVKFLREDVMVMMVVSGQKVDLNVYEKNPDRRD